MIGFFWTTVTHGPNGLAAAREAAERFMGESAGGAAVAASPAYSYAGPLDPGVREISLLAPLPAESLTAAMVMPPVRYFCDPYGAAFLVQVHNAVREGGRLAVPFHRDAVAARTGFWSLGWLTEILGEPDRIVEEEQAAVFRRAQPLHAPPSVLSLFLRDGHAFAADFFRDRVIAATRGYLDLCGDFLVPPLMPLVEEDETQDPKVDLSSELERFFSTMNYSVSGAGYKTAGLRRLMARYLPRDSDLRVVDLGGAAGFVDVELLLTCDGVSRLVNCEPMATNLPLARRMYRSFGARLAGRYSVCPSPAQSYPFDEPVDVVCAFASLLYIPRREVEATLARAWRALRPGGIFVVHENIKRDCFKTKEYYDMMYTVDELEAVLSRFGPIDYFRSTDIMPMEKDKAQELTVFRVVQKA